MSILPNIAWYRAAHSTVWIADADVIMYTEVASQAYYRHPLYLSDPTFVNGGQSVYSWLQLVPGELVCKALGLQPIHFGLVLRIFGGIAIGFGWFALIWQHSRRQWPAFLGAVFLITDGGWIIMRPFVYQWSALASVLLGRASELFAHSPAMHREWRIISPAVVLPFLLLYLWTLRQSVERFSRPRIVASGLAFGLLFFAYFYFWTAAGLGLLLALFVDRERWQVYFHTGWIGGLVGSPELARMYLARRAQGLEWMQRNDEFVPIGRLSEHGRFLLSAALVLITFAVIRHFSRRLMYLWSACAGGFIMTHQQLFSGLQLQNYHWAYIFCPCMTLILVLLAIDFIEQSKTSGGRVARIILALAVALNATAGVYLRGLEALRTADSRRYSREYVEFEQQHRAVVSAPLTPGAVTAGAEHFVQLAMIVDQVTPLASDYPVIWSPSVSDTDFDRRIALNAYLSGMSREQFEASEAEELNHLEDRQIYGVEKRNPAKRAARLSNRMSFYDQIAANSSAAIEHYQVRYVALPAGSQRPAALGSDWSLLQAGPTWEVWGRS